MKKITVGQNYLSSMDFGKKIHKLKTENQAFEVSTSERGDRCLLHNGVKWFEMK